MGSPVEKKKGDITTMTIEGSPRTSETNDEYRDSIKKLIDAAIKTSLDEELRKASQELMDEQRKAIKEILEEQKATLRQIVDEERKAIWDRAEELRRSIIKLGL